MSALLKLVVVFAVFAVCYLTVSNISSIFDNSLRTNEAVYQKIKEEPIINDKFRNVFWFVQISDIHISRYYGPQRAPDLIQFCKQQLDTIKPDLVLATGDLTDAKQRDLRGSKQFIDEWESYAKAVAVCRGIVPVWLDQRGNHDAFDTPDLSHPSNLFRKYSAQGRDHPSSYIYHHIKDFGKYSFIATDATPNPGPRRPFNFLGYIKKSGENQLEQHLRESRTSNMTVGFGHYPSSLVTMETGNSLRYLLRNVTAYVCGHLHTLANMVPRMYARHNTGMLELELGDWKDARIYRILAIDHDMLSFSDEFFGQWPVVIITNPKAASLSSPNHEPLWRMANSTHIRMLVFTLGSVNNIDLYIDDIYLGKPTSAGEPLYVLPWNPALYMKGLHTIKVRVQTSLSNSRIVEQVFSLDGTSPLLPFSGRFILLPDMGLLAKTIFFSLVMVYVGVLLYVRNFKHIRAYYLADKVWGFGPIIRFYNCWLLRLWLVARMNQLMYPLVGYMLYVAVGPWFIGDILENDIGAVFVWGMIVKYTYLPDCLTYVYGIFQILTFNIPILMFLGYQLHYSLIHSKSTWFHTTRHIYIPFLALLLLQIYVAVTEFPAAYGTRALVMGPVRTGAVILALVLYFTAWKTPVTMALTNPHKS